jgi:putative MFS transporter
MWQGRIAAIGFLAVPLIALLSRMIIPAADEVWRFIFYAGGLGFVPFVLGLKFLKESPRWLVARGRIREAEEVVASLTGRDIDLSEAARTVPPKMAVTDMLFGMFTRRYLGRTLLILLLFVCVTPASFLLTAWSTQLLKMLGFSMEEALTAMTVISIGVPAGCFLASLVADLGGRKLPLAALAVLAAIFALIFASVQSLVLLTLLGFTLTAESYPTRMRNTATGFHNGLARLAVSGSQCFIPMIHAAHGFAGIFTTVAILLFLPVIPLLLWGRRTGGRSLEEIE